MMINRRQALQIPIAGIGLASLGGVVGLNYSELAHDFDMAPAGPPPVPAASSEWDDLFANHRFGVALAGLEFGEGRFPGRLNAEVQPPPEDHYAYYAGLGIKSIRLPYLWERIQPNLFGPLDGQLAMLSIDGHLGPKTFARLIHEQLDLAQQHGMKVLLDPHNYGSRPLLSQSGQWQVTGGSGRFGRFAIGTPQVPITAFADFVKRMAAEFGDHPALMGLDIMNEPVKLPAGGETWQIAVQAAINEVRTVNKRVPLFIEGYNYAHSYGWELENPRFHELQDPSDNLIFSAHLYFDEDHSGRYLGDEAREPRRSSTAVSGIELAKDFFDWLDQHGKRGHIGEFGAPDTASWFAVVKPFMDECVKRGVLVHAWGDWPLHSDYVLNLNPQGGPDKRIVRYLTQLVKDAAKFG